MKRRVILGTALVMAASALGGCSDTRKALGLEKAPPDEFAVVQGAPLTLPPDFALRPPRSASAKPAPNTPEQQAKQTVFRMSEPASPPPLARTAGNADAGGLSPGEQALLDRAGASRADPRIRQEVNAETAEIAQRNESWIDSLLFWQDKPEPGEIVDPTKESQRLRENAALGKPVTAGDTPQIERKKRSLLEGIF